MPAPPSQWIKLPPNLVHDKSTMGKSIYQTDYSSKRPMFQIAMQKAQKSSARSSHHPQPPKQRDRRTMRMSQTADYTTLQEAFEKDFEKRGNTCGINLKPTLPLGTEPATGSPTERAVIKKYIDPSLQLVEQSWMDEAHATKRDRNRMYQEGIAGTKIGLQTRPAKKEAKHVKGLPGLNSWLKSSNEYEKAVVYNFMDTVAKATKRQDRQATPKRSPPQPIKPDLSNEYYHRHIDRPRSVRAQRVTEKTQLPKRPSSVSSVTKYVGSPTKGQEHPKEITETHHYYPPPHIHHSEGKCEVCDYYRVKKLLELIKEYDSGKLGEAALSHLLRPRVDPIYYYPEENDDYVHNNSFFSLTNANNRGYFIIAPDWVSERKVILRPRYK